MLKKIGEKIFGTSDEREIKKMQKLVDKINEIEPLFEKLTDEQLSHKTVEFKERLEKETLDDILVELLKDLWVCVTMMFSSLVE